MMFVAIVFFISCFFMYGAGARRRGQVVQGDDGGVFFQDYEVAVINGERIMLSRLEIEVTQLIRSMGIEASVTAEDLPVFRNTVIDRLATLKELDREIASRRITVTEEELNEAVRDVEDQFPTKEIFLQQLRASGITESELRESIAETIKRNKVFEEVTDVVSTDEAELRNFYEMMKAFAFQTPEGYFADVAHFATEEAASGAREELESGKEWDEVMGAVTSGVSDHSSSGERAFIPSSQLTGDVEFIRDLPMNVPSHVVTLAPDDHMIVVKREKQDEATAPFEDVSADIEEIILSQKSASLQSQFMQELRARASVEILDEELFAMASPDVLEDEAVPGEDDAPAHEETTGSESEPVVTEPEAAQGD